MPGSIFRAVIVPQMIALLGIVYFCNRGSVCGCTVPLDLQITTAKEKLLEMYYLWFPLSCFADNQRMIWISNREMFLSA